MNQDLAQSITKIKELELKNNDLEEKLKQKDKEFERKLGERDSFNRK